MDRNKLLNRISFVSIAVNILLSIIKILAGIFGRSGALIADGIHSISDVITTVLAYVGVKMSDKVDDADHQYGHEKYEPVMGKLLATVLFITAIMLAYSATKELQSGVIVKPTILPLFAAILSMVVKEWMYRYTLNGAIILDSSALKADAWHHRSDALSSLGSFIGVGGALLGYTILEPVVTFGIAALIMKVAVDIYLQSVKALMDVSADDNTVKKINSVISSVKGVQSIDMLKTRIHGNRIYVDLEIAVYENLTVKVAHAIAEEVHDSIEESNRKIKHCMVHVNPSKSNN
ncbi:MAG: cation diffusion facilitator family transporter [Acidaminobacteraceae bacterium]